MKLENYNGIQYIVLEENDKVCLTTKGLFDVDKNRGINIKCQNNGLNISDDSSIIDTIGGNEMLEKVSTSSMLSSDEIIKKCDEWVEMFKKVHDKFRELVLTDRYRNQEIIMILDFSNIFSSLDENTNIREIKLDLEFADDTIQKGMSIAIDKSNYTVYRYLLARALEHYVSVNYAGSTIDIGEFQRRGLLYSNYKTERICIVPMMFLLEPTRMSETEEYDEALDLATKIIVNHNLNQSSEQIFDDLKHEIYSQQMNEDFNKSIDYSARQFGYIISDSENESTVSRKRV